MNELNWAAPATCLLFEAPDGEGLATRTPIKETTLGLAVQWFMSLDAVTRPKASIQVGEEAGTESKLLQPTDILKLRMIAPES